MKKLINSYKKWTPSTYAIILLLMLPFMLFVLFEFKLDNDFWFLINTGKTILKEGFIHVEPFTIHSGLVFFPQQWLTDIIFYSVYSKFNIGGMYCLIFLCNAVSLFIFYKLSYLIVNNKKRAVLITIVADIFLISSYIFATRPQSFDVILFSLELFLLESYIKKEKKLYLAFIPVLSIILINLHASMWLMLFVLLLPYYVEYAFLKYKKKKTYPITPLIIVTLISLLCGLINPYGFVAIKYLFNSYGVYKINSLIGEMMALSITGSKMIYIVIFIMLYSFYHNKGQNKIRYFLLCIGIAYLALSHYKGVLYLGILMPIVFSYNFKSKAKDGVIKVSLLDKIIYVLGMVRVFVFIVTNIHLNDGVEIKEFADYLDQNANYDIKLYTGYNEGAYMEYRGYKCYIDPRAEVFLKSNNHVADIFDEYYDLELGELNPKEFLEKYQFDYILVDDGSKVFRYELANNNDYEEVQSKKKADDTEIYLYKKVGD